MKSFGPKEGEGEGLDHHRAQDCDARFVPKVIQQRTSTELNIPFAKGEYCVNPLNAELNPICYLLALLAHHFLHVSRIRVKSLTLTVKSLTLRLLMSYIYIYIYIYIYMERLFLMFLDHTRRRTTVGRTPLDE